MTEKDQTLEKILGMMGIGHCKSGEAIRERYYNLTHIAHDDNEKCALALLIVAEYKAGPRDLADSIKEVAELTSKNSQCSHVQSSEDAERKMFILYHRQQDYLVRKDKVSTLNDILKYLFANWKKVGYGMQILNMTARDFSSTSRITKFSTWFCW